MPHFVLEGRSRRKKKATATIATQTGIVPDIIAAQVADEIFKNTPSLIPKAKSLIATLSSKAEAIYRTDSGFAKSLSDADTGRTALRDQMRIWAATYVKDHSKQETTAMSSISTLVASGSKKILPAVKPPASSAALLITAKTYVKKPSKKKAVTPPASKSMSGLQTKLDTLAKKYPGVTFEIQTLKTKQNQIKVTGLGKLTQKDLFELFKAIPNTNHIPNKMAPGTAYFTLFGKKELTGTEENLEAADRPYHVLLERPDGGKWAVQFGDYDKKVVQQEIADRKDSEGPRRLLPHEKVERKILTVPNAKQKTVDEAVKALTASTEAPGKSLGSVASLIAALPVSKLAASDDKFSALKKDDVVFIRSLNKPTHRVVPIAWNSQGGHVIKASYLGTDNQGSLRLFCDTGLTTSEGHGPVTVPKEWVSLEYNVTASILLNPNVGDTGVVYRDPSSTDSEFAASDHEGQGDMFTATVQEVKGQRLRVMITDTSNAVLYKNAWIFATHLYKNPTTDAPAITAELDADMIDGYVMQHIATEIRSGREPQTYVDTIRTNIKNVDPKDVDEALARLDNDGIISIKGKNIYPSSDLMEVYASTLAQRSAVEHAKKEMESAKEAHNRKPSPMTRKRLDVARRTYAKHIKTKKTSVPLILDQGPPKAKRTASGVQMTAGEKPVTIQTHRQALVVLKRRYRKNPTRELMERITKLKAKIAVLESERVAPHQHATHRYEEEKRKRGLTALIEAA